MFYYLMFIIAVLCSVVVYFYQKYTNFLLEFMHNSKLPICAINSKNTVVWSNRIFEKFFNIKINDNLLQHLTINQILNENVVNIHSKTYIVEKQKIKDKTYLIYYPTTSFDFEWWNKIPMPIVIINKNQVIEFANYSFEDLFGSKIYHQSIEIFTNHLNHLDYTQNAKEIIWQTIEGMAPIGTWIYPYSDKIIIFLEHKIEYIKLKNKSQESQHLKLLGHLSSIIIHDFNNLLFALCGLTETLEEKLPNDSTLQQIKKNIEQATNLSNDLLNFIKEKPIESKITEPIHFIPTLKMMLLKLFGSKIIYKADDISPGVIGISEIQLEQILLNMSINSKDVMPNGGKFTIKSFSQTFKKDYQAHTVLIKSGKYYIIQISDTGSGISKENMEKIFSPYFTTKTKGTGLGLASCMRIAEHAGGGIDFTTSSKGTVFKIILPIAEQSATQNSILDEKNSKKFKEKDVKILLVEDQEDIRELMKKYLLKEEYNVIGCSNGKDAVYELKNNHFDCLITDAVLPEMDGSIVAKHAKQYHPKIQILLISGYDFDQLKDKFPQDVYYISKPFKLLQLKEKMIEILNKTRD